MTNLTRFFALILVLGLFLTPLVKAEAKDPAKLSAEEQKLVLKVEKYLKAVSTIKSRFIQASSNGAIAEGWVYLNRPGKFRFDYDPPVPVMIIADGTWVGYYDLELKQTSHALLSSTPANLLVGETIDFKKNVVVTKFHQEKDFLSVSLMDASEDEEGTLTLTFSHSPFMLRQWSVIDAQGIHTDVTLMNPEFGLPLEGKLFVQQDIQEKEQNPVF